MPALGNFVRFDTFNLYFFKKLCRDFLFLATRQISGWGTISYEGEQPNRLKAAEVEINSRNECNLPDRYNGTVLEMMFCAGSFTGPNISDSCQVR